MTLRRNIESRIFHVMNECTESIISYSKKKVNKKKINNNQQLVEHRIVEQDVKAYCQHIFNHMPANVPKQWQHLILVTTENILIKIPIIVHNIYLKREKKRWIIFFCIHKLCSRFFKNKSNPRRQRKYNQILNLFLLNARRKEEKKQQQNCVSLIYLSQKVCNLLSFLNKTAIFGG